MNSIFRTLTDEHCPSHRVPCHTIRIHERTHDTTTRVRVGHWNGDDSRYTENWKGIGSSEGGEDGRRRSIECHTEPGDTSVDRAVERADQGIGNETGRRGEIDILETCSAIQEYDALTR